MVALFPKRRASLLDLKNTLRGIFNPREVVYLELWERKERKERKEQRREEVLAEDKLLNK
jgi:hypothetical protein